MTLSCTSPSKWQGWTTLQSDLQKHDEWKRKWQMEFYPGKFQVLRITCNSQMIEYGYTLYKSTSWNTSTQSNILESHYPINYDGTSTSPTKSIEPLDSWDATFRKTIQSKNPLNPPSKIISGVCHIGVGHVHKRQHPENREIAQRRVTRFILGIDVSPTSLPQWSTLLFL